MHRRGGPHAFGTLSSMSSQLRDAGTTVILSARHMDLVESIADRVLEIDLPEGRTVGSLLHALTARSEVLDVHSEAPSLREFYLRAVGVDPVGADVIGRQGGDAPKQGIGEQRVVPERGAALVERLGEDVLPLEPLQALLAPRAPGHRVAERTAEPLQRGRLEQEALEVVVEAA